VNVFDQDMLYYKCEDFYSKQPLGSSTFNVQLLYSNVIHGCTDGR